MTDCSDKSAAFLKDIRAELVSRGWDACIVPSCDEHGSEYVAPHKNRLKAVTGGRFTGDAGTALVDLHQARIFVDPRFWLQAAAELRGTEWIVMHTGGKPDEKTLEQCIIDDGNEKVKKIREEKGDARLPVKYTVGVDGRLHSMNWYKAFVKKIDDEKLPLVLTMQPPWNIVDEVWHDRPAPMQGPNSAFVLSEGAAGGPDRCVEAKMSIMRDWCNSNKVDGYVISALDDVCWLLNIRGNAIPCVPVIEAYAVVMINKDEGDSFPMQTYLFVDGDVVAEPAVQQHLKQAHVTIKPYANVFTELQSLVMKGMKLAANAGCASVTLASSMGDFFDSQKSPLTEPRAVKSPGEIANMSRAHEDDSLSAVRLFAYLDEGLRSGDRAVCSMNEWDVCKKLEEIRSKTEGYLGPSFFTIAGYGPNGAIVHYEPSHEHPGIKIGTDSMLLLDFGGQYAYGGTTDTTRTVHFGTPTSEQREAFTKVLRCHIALANASLANTRNVTVSHLDVIARQPLWKEHLDYLHGTGHGVGALSVVHETPIVAMRCQDIVKRFVFIQFFFHS